MVRRLVALPRWVRMLVVMLFALATTFASLPLIYLLVSLATTATGDIDLALTYLFALEQPWLTVFMLVAIGSGLVYYVLGWRFYVGTAGTRPVAAPAVGWLVGIGLLMVFIVGLWLVNGTLILNTPIELPNTPVP